MISQKIRQQFLSYFQKRQHAVVPSSPVIPHDDPTLLFINAGMNQFKDVFLGKSKRDYTRAASSQKCIRVGGKHNDLENVGHTKRHLTFFEMLGNFSFGDYFKKEAMAFAWEVTTEVFQFDPQFLFATVLHNDDESFALWKNYLPEGRIVRMSEKDNFWAMGETGPCGPCTELYYDRGVEFGDARSPAEDITGERYLEFWNLVFMQFNRDMAGALEPLPRPCVDTGSGLERVVSIVMGVDSLFETDCLRSIIAEIENISGKVYTLDNTPPFRVIADHLRTLSFAIADGVVPSNIDRGYVLRKVCRRAVRYGRQLGLDKPFLGKLLPRLVSLMGTDYPELKASEMRIDEIITAEEENFLRTLKRGGNLLNQIIASSEKQAHQISGDDAFKLKDTYGLPLEEILLLAKDDGLTVDILRFEELEKEAKERSRQARKVTEQKAEENFFAKHLEEHGPTTFVGYTEHVVEATVVGLLKEDHTVDTLYAGEEGSILLTKTPFYAEKGGQVGDHGLIVTEDARFEVTDCRAPFPDVICHIGMLREGELRVGDRVTCTIDEERRGKIARNHTATHLLHWALQQVLGGHVKQAGSVVDPDRLRFDFAHHKPLSSEELRQIEDLVNEKIRENKQVVVYEIGLEEASKRKEIKQFFGDKYGTLVRVIDIDFSKELCGGTHIDATGKIGLFKITKESSIAAGTRRIEAVTGKMAIDYSRSYEDLLQTAASALKVQTGQFLERVQALVTENRELNNELISLRKARLNDEVNSLQGEIENVGPTRFLAKELPCTLAELKEIADLLMSRNASLFLFLVAKESEKCLLLARASNDLVGRGVHAQALIQTVAPLVSGKGGGRADSAQAGGTGLSSIPEALQQARAWILKALQSAS